MITPDQRLRLALPAMPGTSSLASVEASHGVHTGISAADRALTIRTLADPGATPDSVVCPGHVVPIVAELAGPSRPSDRLGAAIEIAALVDSLGAAICEVLDDRGELASAAQVRDLGEQVGVPVTSVRELARSIDDLGPFGA